MSLHKDLLCGNIKLVGEDRRSDFNQIDIPVIIHTADMIIPLVNKDWGGGINRNLLVRLSFPEFPVCAVMSMIACIAHT